ncbi:hypothetical protein GCM10010170_088990 [Dactylosporangium salmoneum]|uniref:Uncharacterized protein n=1 Tax=Dactylosporangium salmoneum TaxID=53361 RepID=A0ABN3HIR2_9ACTN
MHTVVPAPAGAEAPADGACAAAGADTLADTQITAAALSTTRSRMPASLAEPDRNWGCPARLSLAVIGQRNAA